MSIKVVLMDDHPVVFDGISKARASSFRIAAWVTELDDLATTIDTIQPGVLVTEVRMNGKDALRVIAKILPTFPDLKVIVFTGVQDSTYLARAATLGCFDFVLKTEPVKRLWAAIKTANDGGQPGEQSLLAVTRSRLRRPRQTIELDVPLTHRELQVLRHVSTGLSNREIGASLEISVETVKEHVQSIMRKLNVNDRTQAAIWAVKRGLM